MPESTASAMRGPTPEMRMRALMALGYSEREAQASVRALPAEVTVSEGIRLALKALAR